MGTGRRERSRPGLVGAMFLMPVLLLSLGQAGSTAALFSAHRQEGTTLGALGPTPPSVIPSTVSLRLHVGDRCETAPLAEVRASSGWRVNLSVTASGWLGNNDVEVMPTSIGPGEVAIAFFTKAAVGGPGPIAGQVVVTGEPGNFQTVITLSGEVINPAHASEHEEHDHPPGCRSTPRSRYPTVEPPTIEPMTAEEPLPPSEPSAPSPGEPVVPSPDAGG